MGFSKIIIVLLIGVLITKPRDIPIIKEKLQKIRLYLNSFRFSTEAECINFCLQKITNINSNYNVTHDLRRNK